MLDQVRTCYPAQIISFDAGKQTATVKLSMERIFSDLQAFYKSEDRQVIEDVPVYFTEAGDYCITVDVKEGDDCPVWFAYRGYDHWLYDGKQKAGLDEQGFPYHYMERVNDISDAFVTTGFRPIPHAIPNFQKNALEIRNKSRGQRVTLFEGGNIIFTTLQVMLLSIVLTSLLMPLLLSNYKLLLLQQQGRFMVTRQQNS